MLSALQEAGLTSVLGLVVVQISIRWWQMIRIRVAFLEVLEVCLHEVSMQRSFSIAMETTYALAHQQIQMRYCNSTQSRRPPSISAQCLSMFLIFGQKCSRIVSLEVLLVLLAQHSLPGTPVGTSY
jgi:hypothetical protein